ncbi:hypothetical protein M5689_002618 [Euphorbia peplus]|nr:hypothetical protein M5689_002618 [Euphorbia peplus]
MTPLIKVKAMVDKEKNRVVFAESDEDFGDVLFSFLTIPMGTIVQLTEKPPKKAVGCMNNLYTSVQNLDVKYFRTPECQNMLLHPRNGAPTQCKCLKISIDDIDAQRYCLCEGMKCGLPLPKKFYHNTNQLCCSCGSSTRMSPIKIHSDVGWKSSDPVKAGVFLKGLNRLVISDDLQLMHQTSSESVSLLSDLGVVESAAANALEVREFCITEVEVLNLLKSSLVSKEALTQTLLKKNKLQKAHLFRWSPSLKRKFPFGEAENGKIRVKLFVSKSKKIVCFAEAGEDFVDLVFSFLTTPLGHVLKQLQGACISGSVDNLYKSIVNLNVGYFKSSKEKEVLLNPKMAPKFCYINQLTGVEEVSCDVYFNIPTSIVTIIVKDPKIPKHKEDKSNGGFMAGPANFTVTDNLIVIPISSVSRVTILNKLDVPLSDVKEHVVYVGKEEVSYFLFPILVSFGFWCFGEL